MFASIRDHTDDKGSDDDDIFICGIDIFHCQAQIFAVYCCGRSCPTSEDEPATPATISRSQGMFWACSCPYIV
jgi:hypothetical protein